MKEKDKGKPQRKYEYGKMKVLSSQRCHKR